MVQSSSKIDELRARLRGDPKSRMFLPLAEELRKAGQLDEAERVLREGIDKHPSYLSAWVSLGRVLLVVGNPKGAADAANRALKADPENIVAARLCADAYLAMGEKVEAIKKYKLVLAFLPTDQEVQAHVEELERTLNPDLYHRPITVSPDSPEEFRAFELETEPEPLAEEDLKETRTLPIITNAYEELAPELPRREEPVVQQPLGRAERPQDAVADEAAAFLAAALRGESAPATGPQPDLVASPAPEIELLPETSDDENPFEELPPAPDVATHAADDEFLPETRAYRLFDDESVDSVPEVDVFSPAGTGIAEYVVGQPRESAMPVPGAAGLGLENRFAIRSGPPAGSQPQSDAAATREKVDRLQKWLSAIRHADE